MIQGFSRPVFPSVVNLRVRLCFFTHLSKSRDFYPSRSYI